MAELTAARAQVEAATTADAARAAVVELEALSASSTDSSVSADNDRDNELKLAMEATREQAAQWAAAQPQGRRGGSPDGCGCVGGWVDGDHGLYRRRSSPSLDRYHGHHRIQVIIKTNYVEWAAVIRVRLQVRHMWEAVQYGDVDYYEDRWVLDALIVAVPPEMQFSLSKKRTAKGAWDVIVAARIGSARAHNTTLQSLRKE
jgi:hypothetical protein